MHWNWQLPDWPDFVWRSARFEKAEQRFLVQSGVLVGVFQHLAADELQQVTVEAMSSEAVTTSEIEGEMLNRESVQSSIRRQFGLATDVRRVEPAEQGVAEMMVSLYQNFAAPLRHETLFEWHRMLMKGRRDLRDVGRYRSHAEAMQIVSGALHEPRVHFEAPPTSAVPGEMERFIAWFHRTAPGGAAPLGALTRAGIAHLYFESIHPFEDGNGRIGRAIAEKALAETLGRPTLCALAEVILLRRKKYYAELEAANRSNEITQWLAWFAATALEAQATTEGKVAFVLQKAKILARLAGRLNERQEKAVLRMFREGPAGFRGGLSAGNYRSITGALPATATRDLAELVELQALTRTGELRHTRYHLPILLKPAREFVIRGNGDVE